MTSDMNQRIGALVTYINDRDKQRELVQVALNRLTVSIAASVKRCFQKISGYSKQSVKSFNLKEHSQIKAISFTWDGEAYIIAPSIVALADPTFPFAFEGLVGRTVFFHEGKDRTTPLLEIYIRADEVWASDGILKTLNSELTDVSIDQFILSFLETMTQSIELTHRPLQKTEYDPNTQQFKEYIGFKSPLDQGNL